MVNGCSNHSDKERQKNDYYATDPFIVRQFLKETNIKLNNNILEPCCGQGHISKVLEEFGYNVTSTDLIDRNYGMGG